MTNEFVRLALGIREGVWPPDAWNDALVSMGRIIFNWNTVEKTFINILNELAGGGHKAVILTAHMQNGVRADAVRTLARERFDEPVYDHLLHSTNLFNALKERRNFFVHSFNSITLKGNPPTPTVEMNTWTARGRLQRTTQEYTASDLEAEARLLVAASNYFALVFCYLHYPDMPEYQTLPDKFPLPDKLQKNLQFPLDD